MTQRHHELADAQPVGIAQRQRGQVRGAIDADERQVDTTVLTDDLAVEPAAVGQPHLQPVGVLDDVGVGDDQAAGLDDEAGAAAAARLGFVVLVLAGGAPHADVDQRWLELLGQVGQELVEAHQLGRRRDRGVLPPVLRLVGGERNGDGRQQRGDQGQDQRQRTTPHKRTLLDAQAPPV